MPDLVDRLIPRSAVLVLLMLAVAAVVTFAAVSHLVARFNANQQSRGRRLYAQGLADMSAHNPAAAVEVLRAALTCDPGNPDYQLNLGRALRDSGRLDEAESYLLSLWQRTPEDGTVNLALARLTARRGSVDDATRYYHTAMYGVWTSGADAGRRKARIELIEFLLKENARSQAEAELASLAAFSPQDAPLELQTAQLLAEAGDYPVALSEYEKVLQLDHANSAALAGAGEAAYHAGRYRTAQRFLQDAVSANSQDSSSRTLLSSASLILQTDPFIRRISDAERNRRIGAAFRQAGERLQSCAAQKGMTLDGSAGRNGTTTRELDSQVPGAAGSGNATPALAELHSRWIAIKPDLPRLRSAAETDLPDAIMDLAFQIEQQTAAECGEPQGADRALLLISRDREAADQ